jgi:hypothetical protein
MNAHSLNCGDIYQSTEPLVTPIEARFSNKIYSNCVYLLFMLHKLFVQKLGEYIDGKSGNIFIM